MLEAAIGVAAVAFQEEMSLRYLCSFQLETIADELVAVFEPYADAGPELPLFSHGVVLEVGLDPLLSEIYIFSVARKRDDNACWLPCQVALWHLIVKVLSDVQCIWGHWLEGSVLLERVVLAGDDLEFVGSFDELSNI